MRYLWMLSLFFAIGTGCTALHIPQSEVLLIERGKKEGDKEKGLSISTSMISRQLIPYGEEVLGLDETDKNLLMVTNMYGISFPRSVRWGEQTAFGWALGSGIIGVDVSREMIRGLYLTVSGNAFGNVETFLQMPVYQGETSGFSIGGYWRYERHGLNNDCRNLDVFLCGVNYSFTSEAKRLERVYRISSFGLRLAQYIDDSEGRLRLRFAIGYSPELNGITFQGGLSAGRSARRSSVKKR